MVTYLTIFPGDLLLGEFAQIRRNLDYFIQGALALAEFHPDWRIPVVRRLLRRSPGGVDAEIEGTLAARKEIEDLCADSV